MSIKWRHKKWPSFLLKIGHDVTVMTLLTRTQFFLENILVNTNPYAKFGALMTFCLMY